MRCSALLLAGGKSTRMGRDKAFLEIDGEPLCLRQLATLRSLSPVQLMIAGPAHLEWSDCEVIADEIPDAGPLGGVAAGLRKCQATHLVVLAVDLPGLTADFLRALLRDCADGKGRVPRIANRFEPLAAVYPKNSAELAAASLESGNFSMQKFVRAAIENNLVALREISENETALFVNLNTPADL